MSEKYPSIIKEKCTFFLMVELFAPDDIMTIGLLRKG